MLNGIDPILIINFRKIPKELDLSKAIPVVAAIQSYIDLPAIPIYLSSRLTGIVIESEDKSIDIDTTVDGIADGGSAAIKQRAINNTVTITMNADRGSTGLTVLMALTDLIFPLITSKEYSMTYMNGAITVLNGFLHSISINQALNSTKYQIVLRIEKPTGQAKPSVPEVGAFSGVRPPL